MAKGRPVPVISHEVNGFSRYDIPESVAFSASAGILYPARVQFLNARECTYIQAGALVRAEAMTHPSFTPFRVRLHRYFCPVQLYHPEMRTNSSNFDMRTMSTNLFWAQNVVSSDNSGDNSAYTTLDYSDPRSLCYFLGLTSGYRYDFYPAAGTPPAAGVAPSGAVNLHGAVRLGSLWVNADPILAYYDIIRNYYAYSQNSRWSWAFPTRLYRGGTTDKYWYLPAPQSSATNYRHASGVAPNFSSGAYSQFLADLTPLDQFYERSFYPTALDTEYFDRTGQLYLMISRTIKELSNYAPETVFGTYTYGYNSSETGGNTPKVSQHLYGLAANSLPFGVAPSMADRFSRLLDPTKHQDISITNVQTVRQLAVAAKSQAYEDLLGAGGSRFSDWLKTFFAANVAHVDRPTLVYSSSFYLNSSPIFSQQTEGLGDYAGVLQGQDSFGKKQQRYCFQEPGYLIDIVSIQPLYYWSGIIKDYAYYDKMDYFNPLFNEVGFQTLPGYQFGLNQPAQSIAVAKEPAYNEFRASYDRVLGEMALIPGLTTAAQPFKIKSSWVQQRAPISYFSTASPSLWQDYVNRTQFVDIEQANSVFTSSMEDNFYINLYYNVSSKSLVTKTFATNLAVR